MSTIVTDSGFTAKPAPRTFHAWTDMFPALPQGTEKQTLAIDIKNTQNPSELTPYLDRLSMIRIDFPNSADGRGFSIARQLRLNGYTGHLRARGHLLADHYAMARRSGFDDVEIDDTLAQRQPQEQWQARANWRAHDYQARLGRI